MITRSRAHSLNKENLAHESKINASDYPKKKNDQDKLIFEIGAKGRCGVDFPITSNMKNSKLGPNERFHEIGLPGLSEPQVVRHFVRLSRKNYSIDTGIYPLGSCTMKHNPRVNEKISRLDGFANIHPMQPQSTVQGALKVIHELASWLKHLTGMHAVAMSPAAGAHGELCGMMAIRSAINAKREKRRRILVPDSAHGTNSSTAAMCGYIVDSIPSDNNGRVDLEKFKDKLDTDVAALMLTNPNTCGIFEKDILVLSEEIHKIGGYLYCDGANFNAIVGKVRPGSLGIDAMHLNLHKTFSTPHGGGGPGSGPVVFSESLAPYLPIPYIILEGSDYRIIENINDHKSDLSFGRLKSFHGQMGMFVRALTYILSHGTDGLKKVAEDSVLNANYVASRLKNHISLKYNGPYMHEVLFDDSFFKDTGISTLDFAKVMIDLGIHPMTIYFPLIASGAMLTEPTETESKESLDEFCDKMIWLAKFAKEENLDIFNSAPYFSSVRRLDETGAARDPKLRWE